MYMKNKCSIRRVDYRVFLQITTSGFNLNIKI